MYCLWKDETSRGCSDVCEATSEIECETFCTESRASSPGKIAVGTLANQHHHAVGHPESQVSEMYFDAVAHHDPNHMQLH